MKASLLHTTSDVPNYDSLWIFLAVLERTKTDHVSAIQNLKKKKIEGIEIYSQEKLQSKKMVLMQATNMVISEQKIFFFFP